VLRLTPPEPLLHARQIQRSGPDADAGPGAGAAHSRQRDRPPAPTYPSVRPGRGGLAREAGGRPVWGRAIRWRGDRRRGRLPRDSAQCDWPDDLRRRRPAPGVADARHRGLRIGAFGVARRAPEAPNRETTANLIEIGRFAPKIVSKNIREFSQVAGWLARKFPARANRETIRPQQGIKFVANRN